MDNNQTNVISEAELHAKLQTIFRQMDKGRNRRDRFALAGVWAVFLLALLLCGGCADDNRLRSLAVSEAETIGELPSGLPGVALYVPLPDDLLRDCTLEVTVGDRVNGSWGLVRAVVQEYSGTTGRWSDAIYAPVCSASARGLPSEVEVCGLVPTVRSRVKLSLEPRGGDITDYFNTPLGADKDAKLDKLKAKYWPIAKVSVGPWWFNSGEVTVVAGPPVEYIETRMP